MAAVKKLYRSCDNKILFGICGGLGEYFNIDPTIIRLLWVVFTILSFGAGILVYLLSWFIIPRNPKCRDKI